MQNGPLCCIFLANSHDFSSPKAQSSVTSFVGFERQKPTSPWGVHIIAGMSWFYNWLPNHRRGSSSPAKQKLSLKVQPIYFVLHKSPQNLISHFICCNISILFTLANTFFLILLPLTCLKIISRYQGIPLFKNDSISSV